MLRSETILLLTAKVICLAGPASAGPRLDLKWACQYAELRCYLMQLSFVVTLWSPTFSCAT